MSYEKIPEHAIATCDKCGLKQETVTGLPPDWTTWTDNVGEAQIQCSLPKFHLCLRCSDTAYKIVKNWVSEDVEDA